MNKNKDIKSIIFDLGGVVLTNDWFPDNKDFLNSFTDKLGTTPDKLNKGWRVAWPAFYQGVTTEDEFWSVLQFVAQVKEIDIPFAKDNWRSFQHENENMLDLLLTLKNNYKLYALSTLSKEWMDFKRLKYGLDKYFDLIIYSAQTDFAKPDPEIYRMLLDSIKEDPGECVFIDDTLRNLKPADDLGMFTVLFKNQNSLIEKLIELGVKC